MKLQLNSLVFLLAGLYAHNASAETPLVEFTSMPTANQFVKPGNTGYIFYTLRNNTNVTLPLSYSFSSPYASVSTFGNTCGNAIRGKTTCVLPVKYSAPASNKLDSVVVNINYQGRAPLTNTVLFNVNSNITCELLNLAAYQTEFCQTQYQKVVNNMLGVINTTNSDVQNHQTLGGMFGIYQNQTGFDTICYVSCGLRALNGTPPDSETLFELASVTKTLTTSVLGTFLVNGTITTANDHITNYGTAALGYSFTPNEQDVTFQQLATFSGGVCFSDAPNVVQNSPNQPQKQADFVMDINQLDPAAATCLNGQPNVRPEYPTPPYLPTHNFYSNSSVGLLGQVMMHIDGFNVLENGFNDFMCKNVLDVLGMTRSSACLPASAADGSCGASTSVCANTALWTSNQYATGYKILAGQFLQGTPFPFVPWAPAGGIRSNAVDMVKLIRANLGFSTNNTPAQLQLIQGMAKAHDPNAYEPVNGGTQRFNIGSQSPVRGGQGYAWVCSPSPVNAAERICVKLGGHDSFTSFLGLNLTRNYGVVILFNTGSLTPDNGLKTTAAPPSIGVIGTNLLENIS